MNIDVLILNTAVADFRGNEFTFVDKLVGPGGLAKCKTQNMPDYSQQQFSEWIDRGKATVGGPGNTAPLIAKAGLNVAVGVNLGKGIFDGLDAQGRFFYDTMKANNVDMSALYIHPNLPTGTTFIYEKKSSERSGIAYFPNANNDFDFEYYKRHVKRLSPRVVYYMYSGLSDRGDANGGKDLANFIKWCRTSGSVTIVDSHTLTGKPEELVNSDAPVEEYKLLEPLLPELDIFFTSYDEARMIENTLGEKGRSKNISENDYICHFLEFLAEQFCFNNDRMRMFGVTVRDGVYEIHSTNEIRGTNITSSRPVKIESRFMDGEIIDLVGAGDSFRAGLISYISKNIDSFKNGTIDFAQAVQMGNLFASLYIKAPIYDRYINIDSYEKILDVIKRNIKSV